jgi:hypothetical protein
VSAYDWRRLAELHAPKTTEEIAQAAKDLADRGYSDHTVAQILRIDVIAARQMIGDRAPA